MMSIVIIAAIAVGAIAAQLRSAHVSRRTMSDEAINRLLRALPKIEPDPYFHTETDALLKFGEQLIAAHNDYFASMIADENAADQIREATGDLLSALHLPTLKRAYNIQELSSLIAALQRLHRIRSTHLLGNPDNDSACILLQCGIKWLKAVRNHANSVA